MTTWGINAQPAWYLQKDDANRARILKAAVDLGATTVRVGAPWASIQTSASGPSWSILDRMMGAVEDAGLEPYFTLTEPRASVGKFLGWFGGRYATTAEFAQCCASIVKRYPQIRYFEVGNEVNSKLHAFDAKPYAVNYVPLLNAAYDAMHAVRDVQVVAGGLGVGDAEVNDWKDPAAFVQDLYTAHARFDVLSHHPYPINIQKWGWPAVMDVVNADQVTKIEDVRKVMVENHDEAKSIIVSETGLDSVRWTEAQQAEKYPALLGYLDSLPYVSAVFVQSIVDWPWKNRGSANKEQNWGLTRVDGSEKPAFGVVRDIMKGRK